MAKEYVRCVDDKGIHDITLNKYYEMVGRDQTDDTIQIINDEGRELWYYARRFDETKILSEEETKMKRFLKCIDNYNCTNLLDVGVVYELERENEDYYYIKRDNGFIGGGFHKNRFEEVKYGVPVHVPEAPNLQSVAGDIREAFAHQRSRVIEILNSETMEGLQKAVDDLVKLHHLRAQL